MVSVADAYIAIVCRVNEATTEEEHVARRTYLSAWFDGVKFALKLGSAQQGHIIMRADMHYLDQGIDRPMCGGEWLDWKPSTPKGP